MEAVLNTVREGAVGAYDMEDPLAMVRTVTKQAEGLQFFLHFLGYFPYFYNILWDDHCLRGGKWWFLCCWH